MIQLSLMPDYYPQKWIPEDKLSKNKALRTRIRAILRREGFYNYAKLSEEALSHPGDYIIDKYGVTKELLSKILEAEFGHACNYQESIASYLEKVKTIPGWGLAFVQEPAAKSSKKSKTNGKNKHRKG